MTDDQILEVVRAHKEGKKIERRVFSESGFTYEQWVPDPSPSWDFGDTVYRAAPEPRTPRVLNLVYKGNGIWRESSWCVGRREPEVRFLEVIEESFDANNIPESVYCP